VNPRNEYGQTPLHRACWWGHLHIVEILLGHNGIDANVVDKYGDTPLHEAVRGQRYDTVLKMLNKDSVKFDMEGNHKMTPFLQAVEWGHLGVIKTLLAKGAKVNAVNDEGNNCLHLALQKDAFHSEEEHIALLDKCAFKLSLTQGNRTCSTVVATYLFHFGANFYHPNGKNVIPLDLIQDRNLKEKLKTFLPPPCTYCQVMYASSEFKPCEHIALCRDCYIRIKGESCPTCHQPISGVREFEAPKFEDRCVQTEAICQELGAASQAIGAPKCEDRCVQTEANMSGIRGCISGNWAPKFEDRCVQTEATCQELGAASQAIGAPKFEDRCVQTEATCQELGAASQAIGEYKIIVPN
ncbi:ankyrin-1, partial [Octopus sinensis]|uniref:Ankyrin-1 n=1 Tax=Octopus sinensis TaxID=2607531 RepID=A0A7E6EJT7_9MOLL